MMTEESLAARFKTLFAPNGGDFDDTLMKGVAKAIIDEIQQNGVVTTTVTGTVTSGVGAGGAVTGAGTGKIT